MNENVNESFLIKGISAKAASCVLPFILDTGGRSGTGNLAIPLESNPPSLNWGPDEWRKHLLTQYWRAETGHWPYGPNMFSMFDRHDHRHNEGVSFSDYRYDPELSKIDYGTPILVQNVEDKDTGKTKLFTNKTKEEIHVAYSESETLANSVEHSMSNSTHMDVTSETTVSGSYAGVEAEQKLSTSFGVSFDESETENESQEQTEEVAIDFVIKPGEFVLVEVKKEHERTHTAFTVDGVLDFNMLIKWNHWRRHWWKNHFQPKETISIANLHDFGQFMNGYDTNNPEMIGYLNASATAVVHTALRKLLDPENRRVQCSGIKERVYENNVDYDISDLGGKIPDSLADLPVIDANDEEAY